MCIIVYKPADTKMPTWATLEVCFRRNPDGAGFMYAGNDGFVHIRKGFMSFSEFKKAFREEKRYFDFEKSPVVFHFRIKTHGEVSKECCHPFQVSRDLERLRETECKCRYGAAHNGILSGRSTNGQKSDTMDYIMTIVAPLCKMSGDPTRDKNVKQIIEDTIQTSRFVLMSGDGDVAIYGKNWVEEEGIYYSNSTYKPYVAPQKTNYPNTYPYYRQWYSTQPKKQPHFNACKKCAWEKSCAQWGAECMTEADAEFMSEPSVQTYLPAAGVGSRDKGGYYDYSSWE